MSLSFLCMMVGFRQTAGSEANEGQCNYVSGSADRAVSESDSWLPESMTHMRDLEGGGLLYTSVRGKVLRSCLYQKDNMLFDIVSLLRIPRTSLL